MDDAYAFAILNSIASAILFAGTCLGINLATFIAMSQMYNIRRKFMNTALRQDLFWYDKINDENFSAKSADNLNRIKNGIGEKLMMFIFNLTVFISGLAISFVYNWQLALIVYAFAPFIVLSQRIVARVHTVLSRYERNSYAFAGIVAEEAVTAVRTVLVYGGEKREIVTFTERLKAAEKNGKRKGLFTGLGIGVMWLFTYSAYGVALWYGGLLAVDDIDSEPRTITPNTIIVILFTALGGSQSLGMCFNIFGALVEAVQAANAVSETLDSKPTIDPMLNGMKPMAFKGIVAFENVRFVYVAKPEEQVS